VSGEARCIETGELGVAHLGVRRQADKMALDCKLAAKQARGVAELLQVLVASKQIAHVNEPAEARPEACSRL
jgi:hypothetical protein